MLTWTSLRDSAGRICRSNAFAIEAHFTKPLETRELASDSIQADCLDFNGTV